MLQPAISSPKASESGSFHPVLVPSAPQKFLDASPPTTSVPSPPLSTKTDRKNFYWSDEPSIFDSGPLLGHLISPPPANFGPRDFSGLHPGSDPWRSLQHWKGHGQRQRHRNPGFQRNPETRLHPIAGLHILFKILIPRRFHHQFRPIHGC